MGERLVSWLKTEGFCPFHKELESVDHSLTSCLYSKVVVSFVSTVYPTVNVDVLSDPEGSLSHPAGLLTWTRLASHWHTRCAYKKNLADTQTPTPTLNQFLHLWSAFLGDWLHLSSSSLTEPILKGFIAGISSFISGGRFVYSPPPVPTVT